METTSLAAVVAMLTEDAKTARVRTVASSFSNIACAVEALIVVEAKMLLQCVVYEVAGNPIEWLWAFTRPCFIDACAAILASKKVAVVVVLASKA